MLDRVERSIHLVRGQRVMLDSSPAELFAVNVKRLNEQVKRNSGRFPSEFAFQLTRAEAVALRSQNATLEQGRGRHRKHLPWVFTEHGAIMAANVLNSPRAVAVSVLVVQAFVRLRHALSASRALEQKLKQLETRVGNHDVAFRELVEAIRRLAEPPPASIGRRIGFRTQE